MIQRLGSLLHLLFVVYCTGIENWLIWLVSYLICVFSSMTNVLSMSCDIGHNVVQLLIPARHPLTQDAHQHTFQLARPLADTKARHYGIDQNHQLACWSHLLWFVVDRVATASRYEQSASTMATQSTTHYIILLWWAVVYWRLATCCEILISA